MIKRYQFKGVPVDLVRKITQDTLVGLDFLHRICQIIHTDLKPENVLVANPKGIPVDKHGQPLISAQMIEEICGPGAQVSNGIGEALGAVAGKGLSKFGEESGMMILDESDSC